MRRPFAILASCIAAILLGSLAVLHFLRPSHPHPDAQTVITRVREVARLETLDLSVYKKIDFQPDPTPSASLWGAVWSWARYKLAPSQGKAIVFADVHVGLNLDRLDAKHLRIVGDRVQLVLPPLQTRVELKPGETEVIRSNLDSAETTQLLQLAKEAFEREALEDKAIQTKARESAKRAIGGLLYTLGFQKVEFVDRLPTLDAN